jgi:transcriptional regulator with XRE-family HTH domain
MAPVVRSVSGSARDLHNGLATAEFLEEFVRGHEHMMTAILSRCNSFSGKPFHDLTAILAGMPEADEKLVGQRLRALQKYLKLETVRDFAERVKAERSAASNWLNGYNFPRVSSMAVIMDLVPGITLDWIYLGIPDAVPMSLAITLTALVDGEKIPVVAPEPASPAAKESARQWAARKKATSR